MRASSAQPSPTSPVVTCHRAHQDAPHRTKCCHNALETRSLSCACLRPFIIFSIPAMHEIFQIATTLAAGVLATSIAVAQTGRTVSVLAPPQVGQSATFEMHYPIAASGRINFFLLTPHTPLVQQIPIPGFTSSGSLRIDPTAILGNFVTILDNTGVTSVAVPIPNVPSAAGFALDTQTLDADFTIGDLAWSDNDVESVVVPAALSVDLVIFAGQSNADGREVIANLPSATEIFYNMGRGNLNIYYKPAQRTSATVTAESFADNGAWWTLSDVHNAGNAETHQVIGFAGSNVATQTAALFGPELAFGQKYFEHYGANIEVRILKAAVGNSSINNEWDTENAGPGSLWSYFTTYIYNPAVADIVAEGKSVGRIFFIWIQGQADAASSGQANDYENQLGYLYNRVDNELTAGTGVTIIDIGIPFATSGTSNGGVVEAAKAAVAASRSNVHYFPADGSSIYPEYGVRTGDTIHFSGAGYDDMMEDVVGWFIANDLPFLISAPAISGTAAIGETLTTTDGTWRNGTTFTYRWKRNGSKISGATSSTFVITDPGNHKCEITPVQPGAYPATSNTIIVTSAYTTPADASSQASLAMRLLAGCSKPQARELPSSTASGNPSADCSALSAFARSSTA